MIAIPGRWTDVRYFHFPFSSVVLQALLPPSLKIVEFQGMAWLSLVYFFAETLYQGQAILHYKSLNVRTYVQPRDGGPVGVYFLKLYTDAASVATIGSLLGLPYEKVMIDKGSVESVGGAQDETLQVVSLDHSQQVPLLSTTFYQSNHTVEPRHSLAQQLSTQWYGYRAIWGRYLWRLEVHHEPFNLYAGEVVIENRDLQFAARPIFEQLGLVPPDPETDPVAPPLVFCSEGGDVKQLLPRIYRVGDSPRSI